MGANAGGSSLDPIGPAVCLRTMSNGQALDLELNAVDGGGGHAVGLFACDKCSTSGARGAGRNLKIRLR